MAIAFNINRANASVNANPNARRMTISGAVLSLSQASAELLNIVFPNNSGDPEPGLQEG